MQNMIKRRAWLKSASGVLALPALKAFGAEGLFQTPPKRLVFLNFGWGVTEESWYPDRSVVGADFKLPSGLAPLERHRETLSIVQGLWHKNCVYNDAGHYGSTFWLTGANRFAKPGVSFANSVSADQVVAQQFGQHTRFNSIQCNGGNVNGDGHGPGLSMAWDFKGKPIGGQNNPTSMYHHLFSSSKTPPEEVRQRLEEKKSVLDAMMVNAKRLRGRLGKDDQEKLDEYFESVRTLERRIAKEDKWLDVPRPNSTVKEPESVPSGKHTIETMYDLIVSAFQTDSTRVITFRQPVQSLLNSEGVEVGGHDISHYHGNAEKMAASQKRDLVQSELFAGFLDRLKAAKEADGSSLLDHTCIVYGSNLRTSHSLDNCPTIVAGGASGIKPGHFIAPTDTPLNDLWLTLINQLGVQTATHGDSNGVLTDLMI